MNVSIARIHRNTALIEIRKDEPLFRHAVACKFFGDGYSTIYRIMYKGPVSKLPAFWEEVRQRELEAAK